MFGPLSELSNRMQWLREELEPAFTPPLSVHEDGETIVVAMEVPGLKTGDVEVTFDQGELTLKGEKKFEAKENTPVHRQERGYGAFSRTLTLPWEIVADKISAEMKDGVLTVTLPKAEVAKPRKVAVKYTEPKQ
ncbi:MAG TPA: Hsp20/alpha crystallin family protein [Planctomycetota bacterium]|nr:Hsp20/alpha crystallin family protein [Planctomycetota bacterium]